MTSLTRGVLQIQFLILADDDSESAWATLFRCVFGWAVNPCTEKDTATWVAAYRDQLARRTATRAWKSDDETRPL